MKGACILTALSGRIEHGVVEAQTFGMLDHEAAILLHFVFRHAAMRELRV